MTSSQEGERLIDVVEAPADFIGSRGPYINLDNAATTPVAVPVLQAVESFIGIYGSIHRGAGLKSIISSELFEGAVERIRAFVGGCIDDVVVLSFNTTTAINRLAVCLDFKASDIVLVSEIEHSSNDLPWRQYANVRYFRSTKEGALDLNDLEEQLERAQGRVRLVAVTGASNVSGYISPLNEVTRLAHTFDAEVFVDAAQLVAHRPIQIRTGDAGNDIDYVAFSGHKMYAPFGIGAVVGRRQPFERVPPDLPGGGTVNMVTPRGEIWAGLPERTLPGTPNAIGVISLAAAIQMITRLGYGAIRDHENVLIETGLQVLKDIPTLRLYGQEVFTQRVDRLPIFPFTLRDFSHQILAAILGFEHGIAVRHGHLCQYEFMRRQLGISAEEQRRIENDLHIGDKGSMYGMVRASCGLCTSASDLLALGNALRVIVDKGSTLKYQEDRSKGRYTCGDERTFIEECMPSELRFLLSPRRT